MRIVVAMSGGVDSSTAAALLVEAGHEVIGLAMKTHASTSGPQQGCCTPSDMHDARRVADLLNIPFYVLNYTEEFHEAVIHPFAQAYQAGCTPNPCIECNDKVKFHTLLKRARLLGAHRLATGHYARIDHHQGQPILKRGLDRRKDQSYFLYRLRPHQLTELIFPLGEMDKAQVRAHAKRLGLPVASKSESQEICFVGSEGYAKTVERILGHGGRQGPVVDGSGQVVGQHEGVHHFTLGQRRGLKITGPKPQYVTGIDAATGQIRVGSREDLLAWHVDLRETLWSQDPPEPQEVIALQQRYRDTPAWARVEILEGQRARIAFEKPVVRGAAGQAAVMYRNDAVVGGGVIDGTTCNG